MKWKKYTLTTTTAAEDIVVSMLNDLGVEGAEIIDNIPLTKEETKGMFIDILPELPQDKGVAEVNFYLDGDEDHSQLLTEIRRELAELAGYLDLGSCTITESETEDKDWINNWKEFFKPFTVGHILIKPTWEPVPENHQDKLLIEMDPGTAFGTGTHETTQLCISQLVKYVKNDDRILDVGCGSGILSIAAIKLGAGSALGTDLDESAVTASRENREVNQIPEEYFQIIQGNIIDDDTVKAQAGFGCYDIVVANILADVIIMLESEVPPHLKPGGLFITSGIIDTKEADVRAALAANPAFEIIETTYQGEWVSFTARRK